MRELGQRVVTFWLSPLQWQRLNAAAEADGRKLAAWVKAIALDAARPR